MRCAVITPIGPGHEYLYEDAIESATQAFATARGPFTDMITVPVDDSRGERGRSAARNTGVQSAAAREADWIFFLDADDVMLPTAFAAVERHVSEGYEGIWGQICETGLHEDAPRLRPRQTAVVEDIADLLSNDPIGLLQMGHFVRTAVALETPFHTAMDVGEDWHYYLRVWSTRRCVKIGEPLFVNRRGAHSTGPRSATGRDWIKAVRRLVDDYRSGRMPEQPA